MKVTKVTKKVEKLVLVDEVTYTLELNEEQAATLFILVGQMTPAEVHEHIKNGLGFYHPHLKDLVKNEYTMTVDERTISPIFKELKEFFNEDNYKK